MGKGQRPGGLQALAAEPLGPVWRHCAGFPQGSGPSRLPSPKPGDLSAGGCLGGREVCVFELWSRALEGAGHAGGP